MTDGAVESLASQLPEQLAPLSEIAFDYAWSWQGGDELFRSIAPHRWELAGENPVRFLHELSRDDLERAAADPALVARASDLAERMRAHRQAAATPAGEATPDRPIGFFCTEFAIHRSLPLYAGGLGVLAGDILKEASDRALPYVGVGLFYRQGYFRQRVDTSGWQHEYWTEVDPDMLPAQLVAGPDGRPLTVSVPVRRREVTVQIWRVDVGRVPLYLLDAVRPENERADQWITMRLYVGDRHFRLAQYALLGLGGMRALRALGLDPAIVHLNEGHAALAPLELVSEHVDGGARFAEALGSVRRRTVFTTHTPIAAGNEAYTPAEIVDAIGGLPARLGVDEKEVLGLGRARPEDPDEPFGMTPLGLRVAGRANGVSRLHGKVARDMWRHLYPDAEPDGVPIGHVTNGVHLPTWMAPPMRALLDRYLGDGWIERAGTPETWEAVDSIPDAALWGVRSELRGALVAYARDRAVTDRLSRGEPVEYVEAGTRAFDVDVLTLGFARRATAYKRLYLLTYDAARALRLLDQPYPMQLLLAGKPHPADEEAKRIVQGLFELKWAPHVSERVAFLEDYDLEMAKHLVSGCDVWINVPRPPLEASGTSGMKAVLNGGLNLSVRDGWWDEAFDGSNGWAIASPPTGDTHAQDAHDAAALYDLLEQQIGPLFYDRDAGGVPRGWCARVKASLKTNGPRFNASRMLADYLRNMY